MLRLCQADIVVGSSLPRSARIYSGIYLAAMLYVTVSAVDVYGCDSEREGENERVRCVCVRTNQAQREENVCV